MSDVFRVAYVYVREAFAGILKETDEGYSFKYDDNYLNESSNPAISLTMPKQESPYVSKNLFPFFDGLIPEGWLLDIVTHNFKLNPRDRFGILLVACKDPIGAVSIRGEKI